MNGRETRSPVRGHRRWKTVLDLDLNTVPPTDNRDREGTSNLATSLQLEALVQGQAERPATIDIEAIDDDVAVCSPTAFAETKRKARRRNRERNEVVDVESDDLVVRLDPIIHKRRRVANATTQEIILDGLYINLDRSNNSSSESEPDLQLVSALLPSPKEPTFSCPICMGSLVEETSTKCGHIFCQKCIRTAISAQMKCPACRKKVLMKDLIRVFLPRS